MESTDVKSLKKNMTNITVDGHVSQLSVKQYSKGMRLSFKITDKTGTIAAVAWNDWLKTRLVDNECRDVKAHRRYTFKSVSVKENSYDKNVEVHFQDNTEVAEENPEFVSLADALTKFDTFHAVRAQIVKVHPNTQTSSGNAMRKISIEDATACVDLVLFDKLCDVLDKLDTDNVCVIDATIMRSDGKSSSFKTYSLTPPSAAISDPSWMSRMDEYRPRKARKVGGLADVTKKDLGSVIPMTLSVVACDEPKAMTSSGRAMQTATVVDTTMRKAKLGIFMDSMEELTNIAVAAGDIVKVSARVSQYDGLSLTTSEVQKESNEEFKSWLENVQPDTFPSIVDNS